MNPNLKTSSKLRQAFFDILFPGDIETNPGPFWKKEDDPLDALQNIIDEQADEISDLKETIEKQGDTITELKNKITELTDKTSEMKVENDKNNEEILKVNRALESDKKSNAKKFEELSEHDSKFGQELLHQKVRYCQNPNLYSTQL